MQMRKLEEMNVQVKKNICYWLQGHHLLPLVQMLINGPDLSNIAHKEAKDQKISS